MKLGAGLFVKVTPKTATPAKILKWADDSFFYALESAAGLPERGALAAEGRLGLVAWPSGEWIAVRDTEDCGPGLAFGPEERAKKSAYQSFDAAIEWSLPGMLSRNLGAPVLWWREYSSERALLIEVESGRPARTTLARSDDVRARLDELGAPDPASFDVDEARRTGQPAGRTIAKFARAATWGALPSAEHIEELAALQAALASGDAAGGALFVALAKAGVLDVAVPWFAAMDASRPEIAAAAKDLAKAAAEAGLAPFYRGLAMAGLQRKRR